MNEADTRAEYIDPANIVQAKASQQCEAFFGGRGGVAGAPLALTDMERRIVDEVVFKLGSQAIDQRRLRLGSEQIGIVHMGLIGGHGKLVSIRAEGSYMSGGRVYPGFDRDGRAVSQTEIISLYAMVDHLELLSFDGFVGALP